MNMKKMLSYTITAALVVSTGLVAVNAGESEAFMLKIGESSYAIPLAPSYFWENLSDEITEEDAEDGLIGYYASEEYPVDLDVYQFPIAEEEADSLLEYAVYEAGLYDVEEIIENSYINTDLIVYSYETEEEYEDELYITENYIYEEGENYYELVFWLDADKKEEELDYVENIMQGMTKVIIMQMD